ncbi:MAG: hypothetical protein V2A79_05695 [Planctomycetota bacterium]
MRSLCVTHGILVLLTCTLPAWAVDPTERTANLPDSWLVLYNLNNPDSVAWANWYQQRRGIPSDHLVGLTASADEHLADLAAVQAEIIGPVRDLLAGDPPLEQSVMGILLGFGLPGHYAAPPIYPTVGGFSIADALQDMTDDTRPPGPFEYQGGQRGYNYDCPTLTNPAWLLPPGGRLTKASMADNRYMTARIDAPTLADAQQLTLRALEIEDLYHSLFGESVWYDYYDPDFPSGDHQWYWLRQGVEAPGLADLPWASFDADTQQPSNDAFRLAIYRLYGWDSGILNSPDPGSRVLGFDYNSWGAVTVRSTTAQGALYVPNALAAGYAAAIGATGEPQCCQSPIPGVLLAALREGWTLGEAFYLCNPFNDWMWSVVGDPFLHLPNGFQEAPQPLKGDVNLDGMVNLRDAAGFRACLAGPGGSVHPVCNPFDFDADGDLDLVDFAGFQVAYTGGEVIPATGDFNGDSQVDLADFAGMIGCETELGPTSVGPGCDAFDFDFDLDVDLKDFRGMQEVCGATGGGALRGGSTGEGRAAVSKP